MAKTGTWWEVLYVILSDSGHLSFLQRFEWSEVNLIPLKITKKINSFLNKEVPGCCLKNCSARLTAACRIKLGNVTISPTPPQVRGIVHTTVLEIHRRHTRISIFLKFNNIIVDCKIWWKNSSLQYFFYTLMRDRYATVAIIFPWILHLYQMHDQNTLITLMTYILNQIIIAEKDLLGLASSTSRWKIL